MKFNCLTVFVFLFFLLFGAEAFASCSPSFSRPLAHRFIIFLTYLLMFFVTFSGLFSVFKAGVCLKKHEQRWRTHILHVALWSLSFCLLYGVHYLGFVFFKPKQTWPSVGELAHFDSYAEYLSDVVVPSLAHPVVFIFFFTALAYVAVFSFLKRRGLCSQSSFRIALIALTIWVVFNFNLVDVQLKPNCCSAALDLTTSSCPVNRPCLRCG